MSKKTVLGTRRRTLDTLLSDHKKNLVKTPRKGWIAEIRSLLGMRAHQLAKKLGTSQSAVAQLETSERSGTVSLHSLKKTAEALNCDLYYVFLPHTNMENELMRRAQKIINHEREKTNVTMALEGQSVQSDPSVRDTLKAAWLVETQDRRLWDEK